MKTQLLTSFNAVFVKGSFNNRQAGIVFIALALPVFLLILSLALTGHLHIQKY